MDRISIKNLFSPDSIGKLDVSSLSTEVLIGSESKSEASSEVKLNIRKMKHAREEKQAKLFAEYENQFKVCIKKIEMANDVGRSQVTWDAPGALYGTHHYVQSECLEYIRRKLRAQKLDVAYVPTRAGRLIISWQNLLNESS